MNNALTTTTRAGILLGALALASLSLSGCSTIGAAVARAHGASATQASADPGTSKDVFTLKVGDCFNNPADGVVTDVNTVSCDTPHDFEDYHHFSLTFASYPAEKTITDKADDVCGGNAFTTFDGVEYGSSTLGLTYSVPDRRELAGR